jgi:anti-sigma-K factor RskA
MSIDLHTLSGAFALNALSTEEAAEFTTHLEQCPSCREEVRELQGVAARLGALEAAAPPTALKARILAAADQQPQLPPEVTPKVTSIETARSRRWAPRLASAAAAVVLIAAAVLGIARPWESDPSSTVAAPVSEVFKAPDAHTATVTTANGGRLRVATSAERGEMAVETRGLPKLEHRTYQMWAVRNNRATSVGLIDDVKAGKVMPIPAAGTTVAITVEPAGGSKHPTARPSVTMDPEDV